MREPGLEFSQNLRHERTGRRAGDTKARAGGETRTGARAEGRNRAWKAIDKLAARMAAAITAAAEAAEVTRRHLRFGFQLLCSQGARI